MQAYAVFVCNIYRYYAMFIFLFTELKNVTWPVVDRAHGVTPDVGPSPVSTCGPRRVFSLIASRDVPSTCYAHHTCTSSSMSSPSQLSPGGVV